MLLAVVSMAHGQSKPAPLSFDVVSIRPSDPGQMGGRIKALPGGHGYTAQNITVKLMIGLMYKVPMRQIKGDPAWLSEEHYDVEARADHPYSLDDLHTMFQSLLADRFGLRFHKETKDGPVFVLTVDPAGLKMKVDDSPQDYAIPMNGFAPRVVGKRVPMSYFCWWLGQTMQRDGRPVLDRTELGGYYDFELNFAPELPAVGDLPPEMRDAPPIEQALREQLGLKLQATKGPVDDFVIDKVERPSAN